MWEAAGRRNRAGGDRYGAGGPVFIRRAEDAGKLVWNTGCHANLTAYLKRKEIKRLARVTDEKGLTLVPLKFYLKRGIVKCELGIAKGKRFFDKRDDIRKRDQKREIEREYRIK